jgi:hypothetical protein
MPLSTNFSDSEFEYVREICHISSKSDLVSVLSGKLNALNAAQVISVQRDIDEWKKIEYGTEKSKGGIKGTDYDKERNRNQITNKMRERLDYPALPSTSTDSSGIGYLAIGLPSWFGGGCDDEFSQQ